MLTVATKNSSIDRSASDEILFCQKLNIENATSGAIRATRSHYLLTQVKDVVALFASGAYGLASVAGEYRPNRGGKAGREKKNRYLLLGPEKTTNDACQKKQQGFRHHLKGGAERLAHDTGGRYRIVSFPAADMKMAGFCPSELNPHRGMICRDYGPQLSLK